MNLSSDSVLTIKQSKEVGSDPISWLGFQEDFIFTSSLEGQASSPLPLFPHRIILTEGKGHIRTWTRPREGVTNESRADLSSTMSATGSGAAADH